jgi:hypothetical protein
MLFLNGISVEFQVLTSGCSEYKPVSEERLKRNALHAIVRAIPRLLLRAAMAVVTCYSCASASQYK